MAFPTGHNQPTGFVAGQLKDGSSFGNIGPVDFNGQKVRFAITLRYYKNTLVAVVGQLKEDGTTVVDPPSIKPRQYLLNIAQLALPNNVQTLKDLAVLVADEAKLTSVGLAPNQLVPVNPSSEPIPFELTADGKVQSFISAADQAKAQAAAAAAQTTALNTLTNSLTGGTSPTGTNTTSTGGVLSSMTMTTKIIIGVVVAVVVGGIIYLATKKKKGGKGK